MIEMVSMSPASMMFEPSGKGPHGIPSQTNLFKVSYYLFMHYQCFKDSMEELE